MKIRIQQKGFTLTETLVAMLITSAILLAVFTLIIEGNTMLFQLKKRNNETISLESSLAVLRSDLNNSLNISELQKLSEEKNKDLLLFNLERFVISPETNLPLLAKIRWSFSQQGIVRSILTPDDNQNAKMLFSNVSVEPQLNFVGADLWELKLLIGNKKSISAIYAISLNERN